jgi:tetratricopeptide (TPR) repeat protein
MSKGRGFRIFISAVTPELGSCRREVARVLRRKGLEVCDQEHFHQGGATLLEQLRAYVESCDAVILLVGDRCGAMATPEHAAALGGIAGFRKYGGDSGQKEASYTQWEYFLAKGAGKKTYTFFTEAGFIPDEANNEDAERRAAQQAYRQWIDRVGEHRDTLTTKAKLIEDVLVLPFPPDLGRPKPANLPYRSLGTLFKGRDAALAELHRSIRRATGARASAIVGTASTVHGLGGVGKTRLAVEYAWQHADDYNALLFVVAASPAELERNLAALAGPLVLDLPEHDAPEEAARLAAVLAWLGANRGWLLILDNVDTKEAAAAAEALLPRLAAGDVLITSRLSRWSRQVAPLELDVLGLDDAVAFLMERTDRRRRKAPSDAADARTLARELGELALALEQAGAYIEERRLSFAQYLAEWQSNRDTVSEWFDPRVMQYDKSFAVTWQTSVAQLSAPARALLERLAWLAPDPVPESLLDVAVPGDDNAAANAHAALADLDRYSLVTRAAAAPAFTVHRLVQDVTRRRLQASPSPRLPSGDPQRRPAQNEPEGMRGEEPAPDLIRGRGEGQPQTQLPAMSAPTAAPAALTQALGWINSAFVGDPGDVRSWPVLDPLAPHAAAVAQQADAAGIPEPTARLMNQLGYLSYSKALHGQGERLMRRALEIDETTFGPKHPNVATRLNNLAQLLKATNRLGEAEPLMRRALKIDETSFGPEHPEVATDLNNLAQLLQATNRLAEAEPLLRRVVEIFEEVERDTGHMHPNYAGSLNNLAQLLQDTNRLGEAEPLMRRALAIDEASFGPEHPEVATDLNNLAALLKATNRLGEAEPLMRRALAIDERSFGPEHPDVAIDLNNLAALLQDTNRLGEAEPLMRRALAIDEASFGPEHPSVAIRLNNLAGLLQDTNRLGEAEPLMRRALAIDETSFGPGHPNVARDLNNLAQLLQATNRLGDAEPLMRGALAIFEASLGPDHPSTRTVRGNLAALLREAGLEVETEPAPRTSPGPTPPAAPPAPQPQAPKPGFLSRLFRGR